MILFYSLMPILMLKASATFFNLSLLTVNFLTLLVGLLVFKESVSFSSSFAVIFLVFLDFLGCICHYYVGTSDVQLAGRARL